MPRHLRDVGFVEFAYAGFGGEGGEERGVGVANHALVVVGYGLFGDGALWVRG